MRGLSGCMMAVYLHIFVIVIVFELLLLLLIPFSLAFFDHKLYLYYKYEL